MIGVDVVDVERIVKMNKNGALEERILTDGEKEYLSRKSKQIVSGRKFSEYDYSLAGMFASKEAALKAMGLGLGIINVKDIEICHNGSGKPYLCISAEALKKTKQTVPKSNQRYH